MILTAVIPPLWRRVMDHRVLAHYDGDLARVNIQPARTCRECSRATARRSRRARVTAGAQRGSTGHAVSRCRCPAAATCSTSSRGTRARASRPGTRLERGARRLGLPRLRRSRQGRLRALTGTGEPTRGRDCRCAIARAQPPRSAPPTRLAARALLRNTLLDAARRELAAARLGEITMADIAARRGRQPPDAVQGVRLAR